LAFLVIGEGVCYAPPLLFFRPVPPVSQVDRDPALLAPPVAVKRCLHGPFPYGPPCRLDRSFFFSHVLFFFHVFGAVFSPGDFARSCPFYAGSFFCPALSPPGIGSRSNSRPVPEGFPRFSTTVRPIPPISLFSPRNPKRFQLLTSWSTRLVLGFQIFLSWLTGFSCLSVPSLRRGKIPFPCVARPSPLLGFFAFAGPGNVFFFFSWTPQSLIRFPVCRFHFDGVDVAFLDAPCAV